MPTGGGSIRATGCGDIFWWKIQGDRGGAWKCLLGDPGLHSFEPGKGGAGCGEGRYGVVCLEQLASVSEGAMGAAGVFGDGDGFSGGWVSG